VQAEPEPVRSPRQLGVDRGWVVVMAIVALIGTALVKPWVPANPRPLASPFVVAPERTSVALARAPAAPTQSARGGEIRHTTVEPLSLADVRDRASSLGSGHTVSTAVVATSRDTVSIEFVDSAPRTTRLGTNCDGGALLSDGSEQIGVVTEDVPLSRLSIERLFRRGQAVRVPAVVTEQAPDGAIMSPAQGGFWPIGYYSLTVRMHGAAHVVPFCVGKLIRLVDYSLIAFMPAGADGSEARRALQAP
jgi:hypothetical protein